MILPLDRVQVLPGEKEIPNGVIPPGKLVVQWTIDLPIVGQTPQGKITHCGDLDALRSGKMHYTKDA